MLRVPFCLNAVYYRSVYCAGLLPQVHELIRLCDDPLLQFSAEQYMQAKSASNNSDGLDVVASLGSVSKSVSDEQPKSPEKVWKWSGSSFVKSPTVEPWVKYNSLIFLFNDIPLYFYEGFFYQH